MEAKPIAAAKYQASNCAIPVLSFLLYPPMSTARDFRYSSRGPIIKKEEMSMVRGFSVRRVNTTQKNSTAKAGIQTMIPMIKTGSNAFRVHLKIPLFPAKKYSQKRPGRSNNKIILTRVIAVIFSINS